MRSYSEAIFITMMISSSLHRAVAQNDVFDGCSIEDYYRELLDTNTPPESWNPETLGRLLQETHRDSLPYTSSAEDVWDALVDLDSVGSDVRLIYSQVLVDATLRGTPDTWNREHLWPRSRGLEESGPDNTDVHALRPCDWNVNSVRQNLFFGDCQDECTRRPADEEAAEDTARNSDMFLPPASVRGDIARALFYMERRYSSFDESNTEVLELTDCPDTEGVSYQMAYLSDLLRWHEEDPPDNEERLRNARVCSRWQGNRNPFVDYPELAASIYGPPASKPYDCGDGIDTGNETPKPTGSPETLTLNPTASPTRLADDETGDVGTSGPDSCSQLSSGDVQVVSMSADNPDTVVLVALVGLPEGLDLYMTDNAWTGDDFTTNEGTLKLSLQDPINHGSIFGFGDPTSVALGDAWESVGSASFALAVGGDSILVYCIDENDGSYRHIGGLISGRWAKIGDSELSTNDSVIPDELDTFSLGAVEIVEGWDNVVYEGPISGSRGSILGSLADPANWKGSNSEQLIYQGGNFEIDGCGCGGANRTSMHAIITFVFLVMGISWINLL